MNATARARTRVPQERAVVPEGGSPAAGTQPIRVPAAGSDVAQPPARLELCGLIVRDGSPDLPRVPHPLVARGTRAVSRIDALPATAPWRCCQPFDPPSRVCYCPDECECECIVCGCWYRHRNNPPEDGGRLTHTHTRNDPGPVRTHRDSGATPDAGGPTDVPV